MAFYIDRDVAQNLSGNLELDTKGDLKLADALETHKGAANFVLRTDYGDYAPDITVGANLGSFIGSTNNRENHGHMEYNINKVLQEVIFSTTDAQADVVPYSFDQALCLVNIAGSFLIDGEFVTVQEERIVYNFPYIDGQVTPLTI